MRNAIRRCVGEPQAFLQEVWTQEARLYRAADAGAYADVLCLADVDNAIGTGGLRHPSLRLVRDGEPLARSRYLTTHCTGGQRVSDAIDSENVLAAFAAGATVVLQAVHRFHRPVQAFCDSLEQFFGHPMQANAYLTPPEARGLAVHHDTHDVLVLQLHGTKRWFLYNAPVLDPVPSYPRDKRHEQPGEPTEVIELSPGDCLYLPRGVPHHAEGLDGAALHLTLGIRSPTWLDVLQRVMKRAHELPALRKSLPVRYAMHPGEFEAEADAVLERTAQWLRERDGAALATSEAKRARRLRGPAAAGRLTATAGAIVVEEHTLLERASEVPWQIELDEEHATLWAGCAALRFPQRVLPALKIVESAQELRAKDLSDTLDGPGRLVLLRRLHREGFVRIVSP